MILKYISRALLIILMISGTGFSQIGPTDFVLDRSKEYVYIAFDHVAERKPVDLGDSDKGVWLRLVNNCRLPILVTVVGEYQYGPGDVILNEEVVPWGPWTDFRSGKVTSRPKNLKLPHGPRADTGGSIRIQPGKDLLFSVPADHLSVNWYLRVRFDLDLLTPSRPGSAVYSYAAFDWWNIPEEFRKGTRIGVHPGGKTHDKTRPR
jgi:hypothetical protein